jgi:hypothetical protein
LAIVISAYALLAGQRQHEDERSSEILDAIFEDWDNLSVAFTENWEVKHLEEPSATYYQVRDQLQRALAGRSQEERLRVLMLERAMASRLITMFEHAQKQWVLATEAGDGRRLEMLEIEMDFWTQNMLRNPRMLWYWSEAGGVLLHMADPPTVPFYNARVLNDPAHPLTERPDPIGVVPGVNEE